MNGNAVASGAGLKAALQRCRDRSEARAFLQLVEVDPAAAAEARTRLALFGAPPKEDAQKEDLVTSYDGAAVVREGQGASEDELPPLDDFGALAGPVAETESSSFVGAAEASAAAAAASEPLAAPEPTGARGAAPRLPAFLARNLVAADRLGYRRPTPVQRHCLPVALAELDLLACAETGSGKTVAFLVPVLAALARGEGPTKVGKVYCRCSGQKLHRLSGAWMPCSHSLPLTSWHVLGAPANA